MAKGNLRSILDEIRAATDNLGRFQQYASDAERARDRLIARAMRDTSISVKSISEISGLSRARLYQIRDKID